MAKQSTLIGGLGLGAGLMYFLDPGRGRRRRALMRDKTVRFWTKSGDAVEKIGRNLRDRTGGIVHEMRSRTGGGEEHVPDHVLIDRVRSKMGRLVSHPRAIQVTAEQGRVILSGPILADEVDRLISAVERVRGVQEVENRLEVHSERDIPSLQGGAPRSERRWEILQTNWSPSMRLLMAGTGSGLAAFGGLRRGPLGYALAGLGGGVLLRALTNLEFKRLFGVGAGRRAIEVHKTININAPVEEVYGFWTHCENFPRFMAHVQEVRDLGGGRTHWVACGPAGLSVQWDSIVTRQEPNRMIAWRTEEGSLVQSAGMVHFWPNPHGGTQVDIVMSYNPPGGALGHAVAAIFGADPKRAMDEDLVRLKSLIENHKTSVGHETIHREEVPI